MNQALVVKEDMSLSELGSVFVKSGFFQDARDASQAIVKILAGREMGFGPIASMTGIYIVKGKPSMGANLIAAAIKRSGRYDYRVKSLTDEGCQIEFFEIIAGKRELIGVSPFNIVDAKRAGTQNTDKFPRNMLFARAMSNGAKWFCADVFGGPIYTPEELGATVDENGDAVSGLQWTEPIVSTQDAKIVDDDLPTSDLPATDDSLAHVVKDGPPAPEPKPATPTNGKKLMPAAIKTKHITELFDSLAAATHYYDGKDGKPNGYHVQLSTRKIGYAEITDENWNHIVNDLIQHAKEQDALKNAPQ